MLGAWSAWAQWPNDVWVWSFAVLWDLGSRHCKVPQNNGLSPRTVGGTPNRDPCSLWGLIWGLPKDIGVIQ